MKSLLLKTLGNYSKTSNFNGFFFGLLFVMSVIST